MTDADSVDSVPFISCTLVVSVEKQETQSEYETETLHVPCSIRLAAWI